MQRLKASWKQLPDKPRRILTFIVGVMLIVTSGLIGWIPGPGGMIPFLLGIAVLATEFAWAERFRDYILDTLKQIGVAARQRPYIATFIAVTAASIITCVAYVFYTQIL